MALKKPKLGCSYTRSILSRIWSENHYEMSINDSHPSTIVCPITTKVFKGPTILRIHLSKKETNIKKDSDILVDQIRSIDNKRFIKHIGVLNKRHKIVLLENLKVLILE